MASDTELNPLDFPEHRELTHRAHRFPGKFHPPLIKDIIERRSHHETIADPMCGSGTVGVEAIAKNRDVLCCDLDPLSCLMTRGKTKPVSPAELRNVSKRILSLVDRFPSEGDFRKDEAKDEIHENLQGTPSVPPMNLFHWFEPHVAVGYSRLLRAAYDVLEIESNVMRDAIRTSLAAIVRKISRADPQPVSGLEVTSVRKEQLEEGIEFDVEKSFRRAVGRLAEGYKELNEFDSLGESHVIEGNANRLTEIVEQSYLSPSLIITSPPYCNAIEYTRRHRLEYEWLGLFGGNSLDEQGDNRLERSRDFFGSSTPLKEQLENLEEVPHEEIRSVTDEVEKNANNPKKADLLRKYFLDSYDWLEEIYHVLPPGGEFVMTIGPSTSYGQKINTPKFLTDIACEIGFSKNNSHTYKLTNNKMQYPTNGPTTETESLIEFRKR